jgi:predicted permease
MDSIITKFIIFQLCIWVPIIAGAYFSEKKYIDVQALSQRLITINLISLESFIVLWAIWGLELTSDCIALPIAGLVEVGIGLAAGILASAFAQFKGIQKHTFIISSSLANHGFTMGGFLCYLFLGEKGLALSFIFIIYFMPYVVMVIFSYARYVGSRAPFSLKRYIFTPQNMPLYAVFAALLLHSFDIKRPLINVPLDVMLAISLTIYYFSMGIYFQFKHIKGFWKAHISLAIIKFIIVPMFMFLLLLLPQLSQDIKTVVQLQAFMPAAIYSVITSILFNLDKEMATSMFVVNTVVFSGVIMPVLIAIF